MASILRLTGIFPVWRAEIAPSWRQWFAIIIASRSLLGSNDKRMVRRLAAILRIAEALDHSHRQRVTNLDATFQSGAVGVQINARGDAAEDLRDANRSAELFEKEFHVRMYFRQAAAGRL